MKRTKWVLIGLMLALVAGAVSSLVTFHDSCRVLRAEASEDTAITLTTAGAFASKPSSAIELPVSGGNTGPDNSIEIIVCGGDAANDTFSWRLYAWRKDNGPARLVAYGTGILGTQQVVTYPQGGTATNKFWADTFVITSQHWLKTDSVSTSTVGGNSVSSLWFDGSGYTWLYLEITDADGTSTEAESLTAYYSFF